MEQRPVNVGHWCLLAAMCWVSLSSAHAVPLSLEAKRDIADAADAVGRKDWDSAIRSYAAASEKVPGCSLWSSQQTCAYPPLLFNLALAHEKAGHIGTAIFLTGGYLASAPDASNAQNAHKHLGGLLAREEALRKKLLDVASDIATQSTAGRPIKCSGEGEKTYNFLRSGVARAYAEEGDIDRALAFDPCMKTSEAWRWRFLSPDLPASEGRRVLADHSSGWTPDDLDLAQTIVGRSLNPKEPAQVKTSTAIWLFHARDQTSIDASIEAKAADIQKKLGQMQSDPDEFSTAQLLNALEDPAYLILRLLNDVRSLEAGS